MKSKSLLLEIDNSKEAAVQNGKWKNPGAMLYDQLLHASDSRWQHNGRNTLPEDEVSSKWNYWQDFLKEAYLIAPTKDIQNSPPDEVTPYSRSGCKYPHHVIRGGKLVLSVPGVKAAYSRACQMKEFNGELKEHLVRHMKELGLESYIHESDSWDKIESNFNDIYQYLSEQLGIDLEEPDYTPIINESVKGFDDVIGELGREISEDVFGDPDIADNFNKEVKEKTPRGLWNWMHCNISYGYNTTFYDWRLKDVAQLYKDKKGICHDQSYFEYMILQNWGFESHQLFFVEFSKDTDIGGNSHTLTYYLDDGKLYWFENAWEDQAGIHGPYNSIEDIKEAILDAYNNDSDINSHKFDGIVFGEKSNYSVGMTLGQYVDSWEPDDDRLFTKTPNFDNTQETTIQEQIDWIERFVSDEDFRDDYFEEKKTQTQYAIEDFKRRYNYDAKNSQITVSGQKYFVDIDINNPNVMIGNKSIGRRETSVMPSGYTNHDLCIKGDDNGFEEDIPLIVLDKDFFNVSDWKRREAILLHEIGHIKLHGPSKIQIYNGHMKNIDDGDFQKNRNNAKVNIGPLVNKIHGEGEKEIEADRYAANRTSEKDLIKGLVSINKQSKRQDAKNLVNDYHNKLLQGQYEEYCRRVRDKYNGDKEPVSFETWKASPKVQKRINDAISAYIRTHRDEDKKYLNVARNEDVSARKKALNDPLMRSSDIYKQEFTNNIHVFDSVIFENGDSYFEANEENPTEEEPSKEEKPQSMPKQADVQESDKNGVRRKKLYIAFIEWCKEYNPKNTFGSLFDKDIFHITYPFVPEEMRYFYRLANPILCVLSGDLTFFQVSELRKVNSRNSKLNEMIIFAATPNDMRVFNKKDKKVYRAFDKDGALTLDNVLSNTFDTYIQRMIDQGDILTEPINEDESE